MEEREREVLWDHMGHRVEGALTGAQARSVEFVLRELPLPGEEVSSWRVEAGLKGVFLFAEARVSGERGAQVLLRGN